VSRVRLVETVADAHADMTRTRFSLFTSRASAAAARRHESRRAKRLINQGSGYKIRFDRTGNRADLDGAIDCYGRALTAAPPGPGQVFLLATLSSSLRIRAEIGRDATDLDQALRLGQAAVNSSSVHDPDRDRYRTVLGHAYLTRFEQTADANDAR